MTLLKAKVRRRQTQAQDIASYELVREGGGALPPFSAGAHIDVHLPGGLVRQYSLCNAPHEATHYRLGVLRDAASRGGSLAMHDQVHEGDVLTISEPRNQFPLYSAPHTVLVAGGIGITPLLSMAQQLAATGASFELHACNRSLARSAFLEELRGFGERLHLHLDDGEPAQKLDLPAVLNNAPAGSRLYLCGPGGFIDFVVGTAKAQGWPADHVHLEYFGAAPQDTTGARAFEVRIASTGKSYTIAADQSVTQALAAQGVEIMVACEQGVCGTCLTRVLEGECDHRDMYLTDEEKACHDQFTPCCSRARSALLVLDL